MRFAFEARHAPGVLTKDLGPDLQRRIAVQPGVTGAVDVPHAALTELFLDAVVCDGTFDQRSSPPVKTKGCLV